MPIVGSGLRIYTVKLNGNIGTNATLNVFHYSCNILSQPSAQLVAENFRDEILPEIVPTQTAAQVYGVIEVIDNMDDANFYTLSVSQNGTRAGTTMASFTCWSMRLLRTSRDMRSGWKRFSGITEEDVTGGIFVGAYLSLLQAQAVDIAQDLNIDLVALPLVIVRDGPTANDPGIDPDDPTTWRYTTVGGVSVPDRVTTQNTRKPWN